MTNYFDSDDLLLVLCLGEEASSEDLLVDEELVNLSFLGFMFT